MDKRSRVPHACEMAYDPAAIYYEDSDTLEFVREDAPTRVMRVDATLSLVYDLFDKQKLVGFRISGFKNFYFNELLTRPGGSSRKFTDLVEILEHAFSKVGEHVLKSVEEPYQEAIHLAREERVELSDFPTAGSMS